MLSEILIEDIHADELIDIFDLLYNKSNNIFSKHFKEFKKDYLFIFRKE